MDKAIRLVLTCWHREEKNEVLIGTHESNYGESEQLSSLILWAATGGSLVGDEASLTWEAMFNPLKKKFSKESDERNDFIEDKIEQGAVFKATEGKTLVFNWGNVGQIEKSSRHRNVFMPLFNWGFDDKKANKLCQAMKVRQDVYASELEKAIGKAKDKPIRNHNEDPTADIAI